jgi:Ras-related protein Rab-1A
VKIIISKIINNFTKIILKKNMSKKEAKYKILILGDSKVGKSCFLTRYADKTYQEDYLSTIGMDYKIKNYELENGDIIKLYIWDTAGQDRFRSITSNYYKGADGIILIYDITKQETFNNVRNWITSIKEEAPAKVVLILVGNKVDDEKNRAVPQSEGEKIADEYNLPFLECSAKSDINVTETFDVLIKKIVEINPKNKQGQKLQQNRIVFGEKKKFC